MELTVHDDIILEIGRLAIYQSHIEGQLILFIHQLLDLHEEEANSVTHRLSIRQLLSLAEDILNVRLVTQDAQFLRFKEFKSDLEQIVPLRNRSIHSMWSFGETLDSNSATRVKFEKDATSKRVVRKVETVSLSELRVSVEKMKYLNWFIGDIRIKVG